MLRVLQGLNYQHYHPEKLKKLGRVFQVGASYSSTFTQRGNYTYPCLPFMDDWQGHGFSLNR
ncbi:hypothetical protein AUG19_02375 [archaeon 13_1_20CM_2_54_9]|nr:MAG: hypothetical protein AUJ07_10695 [Crenarchaeota archaeon 13_1_40CM_3_53_5]OLE76613.1 MAG: hypothetical protein AUG19_02375 [archaeon 13_1_20CM_2_54_9]